MFERRRLECFFAAVTFGFGVWLLMPAASMNTDAFRQLLRMMEEQLWGAMFLLNGLIHALALAINGKRWWSPLVRWVASFFTASLYLVMVAGFYQSGWASTAVYTYLSLSIGAAFCAAWAWKDAVAAVRVRNVVHHA